ncbi:MAG TPA: hypothetical protein VND63_00575 [Rhodanobacteraceae bacterium]|nr:hypothetical protein [Rhodanobacteraceae bacterium]
MSAGTRSAQRTAAVEGNALRRGQFGTGDVAARLRRREIDADLEVVAARIAQIGQVDYQGNSLLS